MLEATLCYELRYAPEAAVFGEVAARIAGSEDDSLRAAYIAGLGCLGRADWRRT